METEVLERRLLVACMEGKLDEVISIITTRGVSVNVVVYKNNPDPARARTLLFAACYWRQIGIVRFLISAGANVNSAESAYKLSALHGCAVASHEPAANESKVAIEIGEILLGEGANINAQNEFLHTPLHSACREGSIEMIDWLIERGADVNMPSSIGVTPLHMVCKNGRIDAIHVLLADRGLNVNAQNTDGDTPLHVACDNGRIGAINLLLATEGVNVNVQNKSGDTALHFACIKGNTEIVKLLLKKKAIVDITNTRDVTPLFFVCATTEGNQDGRDTIIRMLLLRGATPADIGRCRFIEEEMTTIRKSILTPGKSKSDSSPLTVTNKDVYSLVMKYIYGDDIQRS